MFPSLGLFSSIRCPDLSAAAGGGSCKRKPCLYSHTAPPPSRTFTLAKRPVPPSANDSPRSSASPGPSKPISGSDSEERAKKVRKEGQSSARVASGRSVSKAEAPPVASTSRIAPLPKSTTALKPKAGYTITGSGKVIKNPLYPPIRVTQSTASSTSNATPSAKGKERASATFQQTPSYMNRPAETPRLPLTVRSSYFPVASRNTMIKSMFLEFARIYANMQPLAIQHKLSTQHALEQEQLLYDKNNKFSYRNACVSTVARLKKRPIAASMQDTGTMEDYEKHLKEESDKRKNHLTLKKAELFTMNRQTMLAHGYFVDVPEEQGGLVPTEEGGTKTCERCRTEYIVRGNLSESEMQACRHHWGRQEMGAKAERVRNWTCCGLPVGSSGCTLGAHVFAESSIEDLHSRVAFTHTDALPSHRGHTALDIAALDCEMVYTTAGLSLARLTILNVSGDVVLDEVVVPNGMLVDLVTRWSGITEEMLLKAKRGIEQLKAEELGKWISEDTIIIGHGLENDLKAMRLIHPAHKVIDTAQLYPHPRGLPYRNSLRALARDHLSIFIQDKGVEGHSSAVDARAALDLVKVKAEKVSQGKGVEALAKASASKSADSATPSGTNAQAASLFTNGF